MGAASAANLRLNGGRLPSHIQALAILVPHQRPYSTETSNSSNSSSSFPPPGFNAEQAKKPLSQQGEKDSQAASTKNAGQSVSSQSDSVAAKPVDEGKLAELEAAKAVSDAKKEKAVEEKKEKKLTIGQKIKKEIQHYWDGTKLLATEVKISTKLAMKMAAGYELSRRENRQVSRNVDCHLLMADPLTRLYRYIASKNCQGSWTAGSVLHVRYCSLR